MKKYVKECINSSCRNIIYVTKQEIISPLICEECQQKNT